MIHRLVYPLTEHCRTYKIHIWASAYHCFKLYCGRWASGSQLAPGPTVTRPRQIPHPGARVLRLVTANFDRRLLESGEICISQLGAIAATTEEGFMCLYVKENTYMSGDPKCAHQTHNDL